MEIKLLADFKYAVYDFVYGSDRKFSDFPDQFSMSRNLGWVRVRKWEDFGWDEERKEATNLSL